MPFRPEPPLPSDQTQRTAVVLCNLGTPDAPTAPAVRRYLAEFLGDPRVVEIPKALWWIILHGIILRTRPKKSAEKYASIWTPDGSPLKVWTAKQATLLRGLTLATAAKASSQVSATSLPSRRIHGRSRRRRVSPST